MEKDLNFEEQCFQHGLELVLETCMSCGEKFLPEMEGFLEDYELPTCDECCSPDSSRIQ